MPLQQFSIMAQFTTDAEFRTWGQTMRAAMTAVGGLVQTPDTGQINWTTVTKPSAANTAAGYEIWRFDDAAQATVPIYMKIEWGTGGSANSPGMYLTLGTGSNGAGTITNIRFPRLYMASSGTPAASLGDNWIATGDGFLALTLNAGTATAAAATYWVVERLRNADGSVDTSALAGTVVAGRSIGTPQFYTQLQDGSMSEQVSGMSWPALAPWQAPGSTGVYQGTTYAYPYFPVLGRPRGAMRSMVAAYVNDTPPNVSWSVQLYGQPHLFRASGAAANAAFARGSTGLAAALRFE
jgi:hypothetical protein